MLLFDRKYYLQIGDAETGEGISIDSLQVKFKVKKSVDNKKKVDKARIAIYNLSDESLAILETDYPVAILSCGYKSNLTRLFYGQIVEVKTTKNGPDRITKLEISPSFTELTHNLMSELVPENGTVQDAIEAVRKNTTLSKGVYRGAQLSNKIVYGYPLSGTPREMIDQICDVYKLQWHIEGTTLHINDYDSVESDLQELAPVISESTGLIDKPYYFSGTTNKKWEQLKDPKDKKTGVRFTALINPNVYPGTIIKITYNQKSQYCRVEEVEFVGDFRGQDWYMTCICSTRPEVTT